MNRIKALVLSIVATFGLMLPVAVPALAEVDPNPNLCAGVDLDASQTDCNDTTDQANDSVTNLANTVVDIFSLVVGIVAVIMIIIAGLRYITSGCEAQNVTNAKNTILYAIVGLVVVVFAQTIVKFVIAKLSE
jgi:cytochrome bd-type quinol oxidase subunit 2